jgi:predicted porin
VDNVDDGKSKGLGVGYLHALSRRTSLYAYLAFFDNDDDVGARYIRGNATVGIDGEKQTSFALGINHKF